MLRPLIIALTLLAGCANPPVTGVSESLSGVSSEAVLSYRFAPASTRIDEVNRRKIRNFLGGLALTQEDILVVSVPAMSGAGKSGREKELRSLLSGYPARLHLLAAGGLPGASTSSDQGIIRVVRVISTTSICSVQSKEVSCANERNLAQMIAHPEDVMFPSRGSRYIPAVQQSQAGPVIPGALP